MRALILIVAATMLATAAQAADLRVKCDFTQYERAVKNASGPALIGNAGSTSPIPLNAVYITDAAIKRKILPQDLFARRTANGAVELIARLINCTDYPMQVQGRASFMDQAQVPTEQASAWQTVFIEPHGTGVYTEVSIGRDAVAYYMIELQSNK